MSFEEFSVTCTTCSTGLKVRDASAIGQIFGCPKCGSMVMVEPPEGMELSGVEPTDSAESKGDGSEVPHDSPGLAPGDWMSHASAAKTGWLLKTVGTIATLLLVGTVGTFAWLKWSNAPSNSQTDNTKQLVESTSSATEDLTHSTLVDATPESPSAVAEEPEVPVESVEVVTTAENFPVTTKPTSDQPITDDVKVEEVFAQASDASESPDSTDDSISSNESTGSLLRDPSIAPSLTPTREVDSGQTLSDLASLLSGSTPAQRDESDAAIESSTKPSPTVAEPKRNTTLANVHVTPQETKTSHELTALTTRKLERRIPAARFDKVPLVDFLRSMMQLSGVPIQLDPRVLLLTASKSSTPVSVAVIDKSTLEILRIALKPVQLAPIIEGHVVRITSPRIEDDGFRAVGYHVADLQSASGDFELATFTQTLIAPETWGGKRTITGTDRKLDATNSPGVLLRVMVFLEKLRAARGLDTHKKLPAHLTALTSRWSQTNRYLDRLINTSIWQPTPLTDVVKQLETETGLQILVDWKSLSRVGVTPKTELTLAVRRKLASKVLADVFDSYDLSLVPLGGKNVQLTSVEAMNDSRYVEFYSMKELSDEAMEVVEELMLSGKAALDGGSDFAVVLGNAALHRQLTN